MLNFLFGNQVFRFVLFFNGFVGSPFGVDNPDQESIF